MLCIFPLGIISAIIWWNKWFNLTPNDFCLIVFFILFHIFGYIRLPLPHYPETGYFSPPSKYIPRLVSASFLFVHKSLVNTRTPKPMLRISRNLIGHFISVCRWSMLSGDLVWPLMPERWTKVKFWALVNKMLIFTHKK